MEDGKSERRIGANASEKNVREGFKGLYLLVIENHSERGGVCVCVCVCVYVFIPRRRTGGEETISTYQQYGSLLPVLSLFHHPFSTPLPASLLSLSSNQVIKTLKET